MLALDEWPMKRIKRGETVRDLELRLRRPDQGWERIVSYSGTMVEAANGDNLIFLSAYDLTEQRKTEAAVQLSESLLRAVTNNSPDPIFLKDRDDLMLLANPATLAALGKRAEQVLGKTDEEFYEDPVAGRRMMANDHRTMASGRTEVVEEVVPGPHGPRTFLSAKTPYRDAGGRVIGSGDPKRKLEA